MDEHLPLSRFQPDLEDLQDILREFEKKSADKLTVSLPATVIESSIGTSPQIISSANEDYQIASVALEAPLCSSLVESCINSVYNIDQHRNIQSDVIPSSLSPVSSYQTLTDRLSTYINMPWNVDPKGKNPRDPYASQPSPSFNTQKPEPYEDARYALMGRRKEEEILEFVSRSQDSDAVRFKGNFLYDNSEETHMASTSSIFQGMSTSSNEPAPDSTSTLDSLVYFSGSEASDEAFAQLDGAAKKQGDEKTDKAEGKKPICEVEKKGVKKQRGPIYAIRTRSHVEVMDDGYRWRKYGQKAVKNSPFPRSYYRCTSIGCPVKKRVERSAEDDGLIITTYEGIHTHHSPSILQESPGYSLMSPQYNEYFGMSSDSTAPALPILDRSTSQLQEEFTDEGLLEDVIVYKKPKPS